MYQKKFYDANRAIKVAQRKRMKTKLKDGEKWEKFIGSLSRDQALFFKMMNRNLKRKAKVRQTNKLNKSKQRCQT